MGVFAANIQGSPPLKNLSVLIGFYKFDILFSTLLYSSLTLLELAGALCYSGPWL
jgi:hypothetical protein